MKSPSTTQALLQSDEELVLDVYQQLVDGRYRPGCRKTDQSHHEQRISEGPRPPPGWIIDVNDPVLLSYDPYFGTERKDDAAPKQFGEDRHYSRDALPIAKTSSLQRTTAPPSCTEVRNDAKGRFVVASRAIKAGEIVAMDTSMFTVVHDSRVFAHAPPQTPSSSSSGRAEEESIKIHAATQWIIRSAQTMRGFTERIVASNRVQLLCSLLTDHGDLQCLPRSNEAAGHSKCACGNSTVAQVFGAAAVQASARVEHDIQHVLRHWWRTEYNISTHALEGGDHRPPSFPSSDHHNSSGDALLLHQARLTVQLLPSELLRESSVVTQCCGTIWKAYGFFARLGLHNPRILSAWFSAWDANALGVHVPDVLERSALFPFVRLIEHSCRPNCSISFLDSPLTHTSGTVGTFNYDTKLDDSDPYESSDKAARKQFSKAQLAQLWWPCETTQRVFSPSVAILTATRDIAMGASISIAYIPAYMPYPERRRALLDRYQFECSCRWCTTEPDLARGFRCPKCPTNQGVICPQADGLKWDLWECVQCGYHPDKENEIPKMLDAEASLARIKADKARGLVALLDDPYVHYSHAIVFKKLDAWSEAAWKDQDANLCIGLIEGLQRCARRVLDPCDVSRAQFHEFMGQVHHAVGNAHTARHEYFTAYQIRLRAGTRLTHWSRKTQYMAAEKGLADLLDSR
jgi:Zn ribbon nucleic-acid-binding protein